jgi:hypothetical protein
VSQEEEENMDFIVGKLRLAHLSFPLSFPYPLPLSVSISVPSVFLIVSIPVPVTCLCLSTNCDCWCWCLLLALFLVLCLLLLLARFLDSCLLLCQVCSCNLIYIFPLLETSLSYSCSCPCLFPPDPCHASYVSDCFTHQWMENQDRRGRGEEDSLGHR